jgi:hypothetical protein
MYVLVTSVVKCFREAGTKLLNIKHASLRLKCIFWYEMGLSFS